MRIVSYNGFSFAANGFSADFPLGADRGAFGIDAPFARRPGLRPAALGAAVTELTVVVEIGYGGVAGFGYPAPSNAFYENAWAALLAGLRPTDTRAKTLVAQRNDGTVVSCEARVVLPQGASLDEDVNFVRASFVSDRVEWRAVTPPSPVSLGNVAADAPSSWASAAFAALGSAPIAPTVTVDPQPGSGSLKRWFVSVTNNLPRPLVRWPRLIDLGSTAGWGGATNANTYVLSDGLEIPREFIAPGESRSLLLIVPDLIAPGQTKTYEVLSGTGHGFPGAPQELRGRFRAPVPDFGWEIRTATASSGSNSVVTLGAGMEPDRWWNGRIYALTGPVAGQDQFVTGNSATQVTVSSPFSANPYAAGAKYLLCAAHTYVGQIDIWNYAVRRTHHTDAPHGLLYLSRAQTAGGEVRDDGPASWRLTKSWPNGDDTSAPRVTEVDDEFYTVPSIKRSWQGGFKNTKVQERGGPDSWVFSSPVPIERVQFDPVFGNPVGIAEGFYGVRELQAEDWTPVWRNTGVYATPTQLALQNVGLEVSPGFHHAVFGLRPRDGAPIPPTLAKDSGNRSGGGASTMDDDSKEWRDGQWVGAKWRVTDGKAKGNNRIVEASDNNTVSWPSNPLPSPSGVPNDTSRYELTHKPLIAALDSGSRWAVHLYVAGIVHDGPLAPQHSHGGQEAERVALRLRVGGGASAADPHVGIELGCNDRRLFVTASESVVVDCEAKTARVMNGATVVKDVSDWVVAYEQGADGVKRAATAWLPVQPGAGTLYAQRAGGGNALATSVVLRPGWLG